MILVDDILHSLDTIDIFDQISYQFQHLRYQIKINSYLTDKTDIVMKKITFSIPSLTLHYNSKNLYM